MFQHITGRANGNSLQVPANGTTVATAPSFKAVGFDLVEGLIHIDVSDGGPKGIVRAFNLRDDATSDRKAHVLQDINRLDHQPNEKRGYKPFPRRLVTPSRFEELSPRHQALYQSKHGEAMKTIVNSDRQVQATAISVPATAMDIDAASMSAPVPKKNSKRSNGVERVADRHPEADSTTSCQFTSGIQRKVRLKHSQNLHSNITLDLDTFQACARVVADHQIIFVWWTAEAAGTLKFTVLAPMLYLSMCSCPQKISCEHSSKLQSHIIRLQHGISAMDFASQGDLIVHTNLVASLRDEDENVFIMRFVKQQWVCFSCPSHLKCEHAVDLPSAPSGVADDSACAGKRAKQVGLPEYMECLDRIGYQFPDCSSHYRPLLELDFVFMSRDRKTIMDDWTVFPKRHRRLYIAMTTVAEEEGTPYRLTSVLGTANGIVEGHEGHTIEDVTIDLVLAFVVGITVATCIRKVQYAPLQRISLIDC